MKKLLACLFVYLFVGVANATVIDTTSGNKLISNDRPSSGQSFAVDNFAVFEDVTFTFANASIGRTFDFTLDDAWSGGNTLFSSSFVVANSGEGTINLNVDVSALSTVFAKIDYNGYLGEAALYGSTAAYDGGHAAFGNKDFPGSTEFPQYDLSFVANFETSSQVSPIPEPSIYAMMALGLLGIAGMSRRKNQA